MAQTLPHAASVSGVYSAELPHEQGWDKVGCGTDWAGPLSGTLSSPVPLIFSIFASSPFDTLICCWRSQTFPPPSLADVLSSCQLNYEIIQSSQLDSWNKCTPCKLWACSIVLWKCPYLQRVMHPSDLTNVSYRPGKMLGSGCHILWIVSPFWCRVLGKNGILYTFFDSIKKPQYSIRAS